MSNMNGWTEIKNSRSGGFEKYRNQMVVVIGKGKNPAIYLTDKVLQALGNPERVRLFVRGNNIGLIASDNGEGFAVIKSDASLKWLSSKTFAHDYALEYGAYKAHLDEGVVVFDSKQTPSK